ncbi:MAG: HD domain-containing protein [Candidatus Woesearchaeota archaeon]|nr:MAG: HD domain-containing protein [Candidatus Woesearchaeota archaeon]
MNVVDCLLIPYLLKRVERVGPVSPFTDRRETTAEHTYSALALADYFLKIIPDLNALTVFRMLLYHDYVEIHAGDVFLLDDKGREEKEQREQAARDRLVTELAPEIATEFKAYWDEFEENKTREAQFCKAIDALDAVLQYIDQPAQWKKHGFTETKLRKFKDPHFVPFPELQAFFEEVLVYCKEHDVLVKE